MPGMYLWNSHPKVYLPIEPYQDSKLDAIVWLSLRAWEPVFESIQTAMDPAVYRGHSEVDLAMTELFGGFPTAFYTAYKKRRPLTDGYEEGRRHLYQLYPLLVHVNLFGGAYVNGTEATLRRALRLG